MNNLDNLIEEIIRKKRECIFISPHLDDAALSAGGLLSNLSRKVRVEVVTVFTECGNNNSLSAKAFLKQCNYRSGKVLFEKRSKEDFDAFNSIHAKTEHLGFKDALWRQKTKVSFINKFLEKILPEFGLIYPTYRFHITKGSLSQQDEDTISSIAEKLKVIISKSKDPVIFCPIGVGNNVDHLVTKKSVEMISEPIYWMDQPYDYRGQKSTSNGNYYRYDFNKNQKIKLISFYKTQVPALFSKGKIPVLKEGFIIGKQIETTLPKTIGNFKLVREIIKDKKPRHFSYGLYFDGKRKAFAKQWVGKKKNKSYYLLKNEIDVYKEFQTILHDNPVFKKKFPNITIPRYISSIGSVNSLTLLIENIIGNQINNLNEDKQISIILNILDFLSEIGKKMNKKRQTIMIRGVFYWISLSPFITALAIIRHPKQIFNIIKALYIFLINIPNIIRFKRESLVHRDLAQWNILKNKEKIYLYDFQLTCITNPVIEYVVLCLKLWGNESLSRKLYKLLRKKYFADNKSLQVFRAYSALFTIYDLSLNDGGKYETATSYLNFVTTSNNFSKQAKYIKNRLIDFKYSRLYIEFIIDYLYSFFLSSEEKIFLKPYNPKLKKIAFDLVDKIHTFEPNLKINIIGSTAFEIDGQYDIDLIAESKTSNFDRYLPSLIKIFGKRYKRRRHFIEWLMNTDGCAVELCLMDPASHKFKKRMLIYNLIKDNKKLIEEYKKLKLSLNGCSLKTYEQERQKFFLKIVLNNNK